MVAASKLMRIWTAGVLPVSVTPSSSFQFYRDQWIQIRDRHVKPDGTLDFEAADAEMRERFPEYYAMKFTATGDESGLRASEQTIDPILAYRREIKNNPEFAFAFVGSDNVGTFDQNIAVWQRAIGVRGRVDSVEEAVQFSKDANAERGWAELNRIDQAIQLKLQERGLRSIQQNGAEDLADIRYRFLNDETDGLFVRNRDFWEEYNSSSAPKAIPLIETMTAAMRDHPELRARPDMVLLLDYAESRTRLQELLAERGLKSLYSQEGVATRGAEDLATAWEAYTADLVDQNIGFSQMWTRVLSRDNLQGAIGET